MQQVQRYTIADSNNKVGVAPSLGGHCKETLAFWQLLEKNNWAYYGTIGTRKYTSIFSKGNMHLSVHHFVRDKASRDLLEAASEFSASEVLLSAGKIEAAMILLSLESNLGMELFVPEQSFLDAWKHEMKQFCPHPQSLRDQLLSEVFDEDLAVLPEIQYSLGHHYHYQSPKHKFMVWAFHEEVDLLLEFYFHMEIPPYGVKEVMPYPDWSAIRLISRNKLPAPKVKHIEAESLNVSTEPPVLQEQLTQATIAPSEEAIRKIFEDNDIVIVAYSGGKDSTICLLLVVKFLLKHPQYQHKFYIVSADTHVENPVIEQHVKSMKAVVVHHLNEEFENGFTEDRFMIVEPPMDMDYITCVFGKSYTPPSSMYKWCIEKIKKNPAERALQRFINDANEEKQTKICQILGVRDSESSTRAKSVDKHFEGFYSKHTSISGLLTAAPIRHWTGEDVVTYLIRYPSPWDQVYPNRNLVNIYGEAAGGMMECPIGAMIGSANDAVKGCSGSGSRFGCWSCTVVGEDNSLKNLVELYPELEPYYIMRGYLKLAQDIRYGTRTAYQRQKGFAKIGSGMGDLTIDVRTTLLRKWKKLGIPMKEEQILLIDRLVKEREVDEGLALSERFFHALYALLPNHVGPGIMNSTIWDPAYLLEEDGTKIAMNPGHLDRWTDEDTAYFTRMKGSRNQIIEQVIKGDAVEIQTHAGRITGTIASFNEFNLVLSRISTVGTTPAKKMDSGTLLFSQIQSLEVVKAAKLKKNQISIFDIA